MDEAVRLVKEHLEKKHKVTSAEMDCKGEARACLERMIEDVTSIKETEGRKEKEKAKERFAKRRERDVHIWIWFLLATLSLAQHAMKS